MTYLRLIPVAVLSCVLAGCPGPHDDQPFFAPDGGCYCLLVSVSGFALDIDVLLTKLRLDPSIDAPSLITASAARGVPIDGWYVDRTKTDVVMSDAQGAFTIMTKANASIQVRTEAVTGFASTLSQESVSVGTAAVTGAPAHVLETSASSTLAGVAAAAGASIADLETNGICLAYTDDHFTPPFVKLSATTIDHIDVAGYDIYAMTDDTTTPPTFAKQSSSPLGRYAIRKASLATNETISITTSTTGSANAFPVAKCDVTPGVVTFVPIDPM